DFYTKQADKITAARKLYNTVRKVNALLLMLGHDLSSHEYSTTDKWDAIDNMSVPVGDIAPFITLAADCAEYLEACFFERYWNDLPMDEFDRQIVGELLGKFPQAQQRAVA
ncbi:MAG TPA: hypothetical protein VFZ59_01155, partial [Verrucomicrobiae bacterium]|nr:hypothetical protein [Verrucomicrobiae bacterium]